MVQELRRLHRQCMVGFYFVFLFFCAFQRAAMRVPLQFLKPTKIFGPFCRWHLVTDIKMARESRTCLFIKNINVPQKIKIESQHGLHKQTLHPDMSKCQECRARMLIGLRSFQKAEATEHLGQSESHKELTSTARSTARAGGGSFKDGKPLGQVSL